jgi:hypothetical protein
MNRDLPSPQQWSVERPCESPLTWHNVHRAEISPRELVDLARIGVPTYLWHASRGRAIRRPRQL